MYRDVVTLSQLLTLFLYLDIRQKRDATDVIAMSGSQLSGDPSDGARSRTWPTSVHVDLSIVRQCHETRGPNYVGLVRIKDISNRRPYLSSSPLDPLPVHTDQIRFFNAINPEASKTAQAPLTNPNGFHPGRRTKCQTTLRPHQTRPSLPKEMQHAIRPNLRHRSQSAKCNNRLAIGAPANKDRALHD
ncbi:uncharacterized protein LOC111264273 [Varroa jacobsoni]|uniref:uncharacterized protein LOC111264273 n=1 Tax=Varroa jacobsoni TaxID=62625 RepID=UPI000BF82AD2|nr:uncharacterized protein LOC111264273 [Varroa jacobsoni]